MDAKGLPKMLHNEVAVYSIAIDANNAKKLYACVGSSKAGEGGVYESSDAGATWVSKSQGLPANYTSPKGEVRGLFPQKLWHESGRHDIASSKDGSLVCLSIIEKSVYWWDASTSSWRRADISDSPTDVLADPFTGGRFLMAAGSSVLVSEDGGRTWSKTLDVKACKSLLNPEAKWFFAGRIAVDPQVKGRLAAVAQDVIFLSQDGGKTWGLVDRGIPDKSEKRCPAFQNGRLIVETVSNGAFWLDLSTAKITPLPKR